MDESSAIASMAASMPRKTPTLISMTTATTSPGRSTKPRPFSRRGVRGRRAALRHQRSRRDAPQLRQERFVDTRRCRRDLRCACRSSPTRCVRLLASAKKKMFAARLQRPTPLHRQDALRELERDVRLGLPCGRPGAGPGRRTQLRPALPRSHSRSTGTASSSLPHVIAYSDPKAQLAPSKGLLDDYVFTALACLDAYEVTGDVTYFRCAQRDHRCDDHAALAMPPPAASSIPKPRLKQVALGALVVRRKAFQDSPTPAGNPGSGACC